MIPDARSTLPVWRIPWGAMPLLSALLCGCTINASTGEAGPYERCENEHGGEAICSDDSDCSGALGYELVCRASCVEHADCLPVTGFEVACETFLSGRLCAVRCTAGQACPGATICGSHERLNGETVQLCF